MKPVTKMIWLIILIILGSGIFFVMLDDADVKNTTQPPASSTPAQ